METSAALGFGFRCGFLGLLHLEIIRERLEREFNIDLIATAPSVIYRVYLTDGTMKELHNPADMPETQRIAKIEEPWIEATILVPDEHLGSVLKLCEDRRGRQKNLTYAGSRAMLVYELPLNEVVFDFYDRLKSCRRGYASFDYHIIGYEEGELVKMALLVNDEPVDALSVIVHKSRAEARGRAMVREAEGPDPAAHVQDPDPGGDRRQGDRAGNDQRAAQGRDRQMLWRRHHAEAQAARQAEGRQEEDARVRQGRHPAGSLHRRAEDGRELAGPAAIPAPKAQAVRSVPARLISREGSMRLVSFLALALALGALPPAGHAAPAGIEGAWSGSGIVKIRNRTDRIVCRVNFDKIAQTSYRLSALVPPGTQLRADRTRVARERQSLSRLCLQHPIQRQGQRLAFAERLSLVGQRERRPRHGKPDPVEKLGFSLSSRGCARRGR